MRIPDRIHKVIEETLWIAIIATLILLNLSISTFISRQNLLSMLIIVGCIIIIAFDQICSKRLPPSKRLMLEFPIICLLIFSISLTYKFINIQYILFFTPILLALALSTLVVIETMWATIGLVAVSCFLLGDVYWGAEISEKAGLTFPITFLRIFSLSLVIFFGYYLYKNKDRLLNKLKIKNIELKNIRSKLESRTKELSKLNERLKYLDTIKSNFVSTVSHELRTPLAAISNSIELIKKICQRKDIYDKDINELIKIIIDNTNRQTNMVENLLNLSRIEKGKVEEERKLANIEKLLQAALNSLRSQAESKSIELDLDLPKKLPLIWCIPDQIQRVFINLIDNAIKCSPANSKIIIKIEEENDDIKCSVKDFGPGIKKEDLSKIFDRFLQINPPAIAIGKIKGAGLGLTICKQIIRIHKGDIWVESELGKGSIFIFRIPKGFRKKKEK